MGLAALMIIFCHSVPYGMVLPFVISKFLLFGNWGVDVFLLLSGLGCSYSLTKTNKVKKWYKRRFFRIAIPYFVVSFIFFCYDVFMTEIDWPMYLYQLSTISFWTHHNAAWFVALLIPLYIIAPLLYRILYASSLNRGGIYCIIIVVFLTWICSVHFSCTGILGNTIHNTQWAFSRVPSFVIGMYLGKPIMEHKKVSFWSLIALLCVWVLARLLLPQCFVEWIISFPLALCMCFFLKSVQRYNIIYCSVLGLGSASLESYLCNVGLCRVMQDYKETLEVFSVFNGHYLDYFLFVFCLGFALIYVTHILSKKISNLFNWLYICHSVLFIKMSKC